MKRLCRQCGSEIEEGLKFCENCGHPVDVETDATVVSPPEPPVPPQRREPPPPPPPPVSRASSTPPPPPPARKPEPVPTPPPPPAVSKPPAAPKPARRKKSPWMWVLIVILLFACLCAVLLAGVGKWASDNQSALPDLIGRLAPAAASAVPPIDFPTKEPPLVYPTLTPPPASPPQPSTGEEFSTNFLESAGNWEGVGGDNFVKGYNSVKKCYTIAAFSDNALVYAVAPLPFKKPFKDMTVRFTGRETAGASMTYGLLFRMKDNKNFYYVGISRNQMTVKKMVNGTRTVLTDPEWIPIKDYNPAQNGDLTTTVFSIGDVISVRVGSVDQVVLADSDLTEGDVALFVDSSGISGGGTDKDSRYAEVQFSDFTAWTE